MLTAPFEACQVQRGRMTERKLGSNAEYFLGLDGGGTKTDCVLVDSSGRHSPVQRQVHPIRFVLATRKRGSR